MYFLTRFLGRHIYNKSTFFVSSAASHLRFYRSPNLRNDAKGTTILAFKNNEDFIVASDSRTSLLHGHGENEREYIVSDYFEKVYTLGCEGSVLVSLAGSVYFSLVGISKMSRVFDDCPNSDAVICSAISFLSNLDVVATIEYIILGYHNGMLRGHMLRYSKSVGSQKSRCISMFRNFKSIGSGSVYVNHFFEDFYEDLVNMDVVMATEYAERSLLYASLFDTSTGGFITVRHFSPTGVKVLSKKSVLDLTILHFESLANYLGNKIGLIAKMILVDETYIVPEVDMERFSLFGEIGRPIACLVGGFCLYFAEFKDRELLTSTQKVCSIHLPFAYNSDSVRFFEYESKILYVIPVTVDSLLNLKGPELVGC